MPQDGVRHNAPSSGTPLAFICNEGRQREFRRDFLAFRPIVIGLALEAARFCVLRPGRMAGLTSLDSRQQHVARFRAFERLLVTTDAGEATVRVVVKFGVRHPAKRGERGLDFWQRLVVKAMAVWGVQPGWQARRLIKTTRIPIGERMTLSAGLAPEQFLSVGRVFRDPLRWGENSKFR